jgi:tetratricopeptide (TPR) repeat protein
MEVLIVNIRNPMNLVEIAALIKQRRYEEAFVECDKFLEEAPEQKCEILRTRAYAYARSGNYAMALKDHESLLEDGGVRAGDFYQAAFDALYADEFVTAIKWFHEVLFLGEREKEVYFRSATYFYLSYAEMRLGNYASAQKYLNEAVTVEPDVGMPLPGVGMWGHQELRKEIQRRESSF